MVGVGGQVLILGASSSLGSSFSSLLTRQGYSRVLSGRRGNPNANYEFVPLDLGDRKTIANFFHSIEGKKFDVIVDFIGALSLDFTSKATYFTIHLARHLEVIEQLTQNLADEGCLVFISSRAALYPSFDVAYSATKAGLTAGVRSLAAKQPEGVTMFSVAPGLIEGSRMFGDMEEFVQDSHRVRSGRSLLNVQQFSEQLMDVVINSGTIPRGSVIELGPVY